jgi:uncharacterized protein (DUF2267 family)
MAMTTTARDVFASTIQKSEEWLNELTRELQWDDPQRTYAAMRATLHTLRDRLPTHEGAQLAAQFPQLIRGVWYEGWKPREKPVAIKHIDEFYAAVERELRGNPNVHIPQAVEGVFKLLASRVSMGEIDDVVSSLPMELRSLWPTP